MTAEQIIADIQAIRWKGMRFNGEITRNNARNKELAFELKKYSPIQQHEDGGASKTCQSFIEIQAVLDSQTGKIAWNYVDPEMEAAADQIIIDTRLHLSLHYILCQRFESANTLKITI